MKKLVFSLLIVMFALVACEGPMGPPGPEGSSGNETQWKIVEYTVKPNHWQLVDGNPNDLGTYFIHEFDVPELSSNIANDGAVLVYYYNAAFNTWSPLPYSVPCYDFDEYGNEVLYTESYSFDFAAGSIGLYFDVSNFYTGYYKPQRDMTFKIVMIY